MYVHLYVPYMYLVGKVSKDKEYCQSCVVYKAVFAVPVVVISISISS